MIQRIEIFRRFVVLLKFISNGAIITNQTGTKKKGRRTGESPAVISVHRMDLGSSDLPPLFNFKSFFMLPKNDECATCAQPEPLTAEQIVKDIIIWDQPANILENLRTMILSFLMYGSPSDEEKRDVYASYFILSESLKQMQVFSN